MKLQDAKICAQCDEVVRAEVYACPSCTCHQFFFLSYKILPMLTREQLDRARTEHRRMEART